MSSAQIKLLILGFISLSLVSCSSFERDWNAIQTHQAQASVPPSLVGCYDGEWRSNANGHHGRLRMILTRDKNAKDTYTARFKANWGNAFTFEYQVPLKFKKVKKVLHCSGGADLGILAGGKYEYRGKVTHSRAPEKLVAVYNSTNDHGLFTLKRKVLENHLFITKAAP